MRFPLLGILALAFSAQCVSAADVPAALRDALPSDTPVSAWPALKPSAGTAWRGDAAAYFVLDENAKSSLVVPRLANPYRSLRWIGEDDRPLPFKPLPAKWEVGLEPPPEKGPRIVVLETVGQPESFDPRSPPVAKPDEEGRIRLPAHHAVVHGENLRYEPQPHKNTIGYWSRPEDWAEWRFESPGGAYVVRVQQGCGEGQGGSRAKVAVSEAAVEFVVRDTAHFQNFEWRELGEIQLDAGEQRLELRAIEKAGVAVMDCRAIELVPKAAPER